MGLHTHYGYICPNCKSTIGVNIGNEDDLKCPNCRTKMVPNEGATPWTMNAHCKHCNTSYGMIDSDKCPTCGRPF